MVLFGQLEFHDKLKRLPSLKSRLNIAKLQPLDRPQTREMMQFRWTVAGGGELPFAEDAIDEIFNVTRGVPRSIVMYCHETLIRTAVERRKIVNKESVIAAVSDLSPEKI